MGDLVMLGNRPEAVAPWLALLARAGVRTKRTSNGSYTFTLAWITDPAEIAGWGRVEEMLAQLREHLSILDPQEQQSFTEYIIGALELALRALPAVKSAFRRADGGG